MPRIPEIRNTHTYQPDAAVRQPFGDPPCSNCGFPKPSRVHDVAETPPEVAEIRDRMLGETRDQERTEGDTP